MWREPGLKTKESLQYCKANNMLAKLMMNIMIIVHIAQVYMDFDGDNPSNKGGAIWRPKLNVHCSVQCDGNASVLHDLDCVGPTSGVHSTLAIFLMSMGYLLNCMYTCVMHLLLMQLGSGGAARIQSPSLAAGVPLCLQDNLDHTPTLVWYLV